MASTSGSRSGAGKKNTSSSSRTRSSSNNKSKTSKTNSKSRSQQTIRTEEESAITNEIILIGVFALSILLFLCNFGIIGPVGNAVSHVMFGIFGMMAYVVPVLIFLGIAFGISNKGNMFAAFKIAAAVLLILLIGVVLELIGGQVPSMEKYSVELLYTVSADSKAGGGVLAGSLAYLLNHFMGMVGAVLLVIVLAIICLVVITEKSFVSGVRVGGRKVYESAREETRVRKERAQKRKEELEARREEEYRLREEEKARKDAEKILRMDKRVSGVMIDTTLAGQNGGPAEELPARTRNDIHEITVEDLAAEKKEAVKVAPKADNIIDFDRIQIHTASQMTLEENDKFGEGMPAETAPEPDPLAQTYRNSDVFSDMKEVSPIHITVKPAGEARSTIFDAPLPDKEEPAGGELYDQVPEQEILPWEEPDSGEPLLQEAMAPAAGMERPKASLPEGRDRFAGGKAPGVYDTGKPAGQAAMDEMRKEGAAAVTHTEAPKKERPYHFPPLSLLQKPGSKNTGDGVKELKNTAAKLQQTLATFGVKVTITDISQGPSVTRYELQPEQGVKVSKILGLADDIKLNLAAMDIRIEAPIPGKAAIGIEVPNKENTMVALRELMESKEFRDFPSKLSFAVGKDIGGKVVVSDIAKMPHMLIAGSTGSGKSVCINTLIMSILYKARPDEVKLILVDPKVVELSVYNGIPHLLIPVVTDPKQASAALHWGVAEMTDRYQKFADHNVRDLKGYNKKVEEQRAKGDPTAPDKLPQIVIIVDELADLMMVSPGEVEESICRLAQLARAAGIHLIIATQRPSVDVITGLIKANMPSRVAFAVSSGVDSRTILDMNLSLIHI